MPRDHKIQIVIRNGNISARVTWIENGKRKALWRSGKNKTEARDRLREALKEREILNVSGHYNPRSGVVVRQTRFGTIGRMVG